jgi:hypothetical protein
MEGHYGSVNADDNGAVSIGACQWHGNRAKSLLRNIIKRDEETAVHLLAKYLVAEIKGSTSWANRTLDGIEKLAISMLLETGHGRQVQEILANNDIKNYINHVVTLGIGEEEIIIFLADIENQGGAGASTRIAKQAIKDYGEDATLDDVLKTANRDKVFSKYKERRLVVYKKLTGMPFMCDDHRITNYTVVKGDTLTKISKRFNTPFDFIFNADASPIKDENMILIGQKLIISYPDNIKEVRK